ncbi:3-methyladenine DNA glycosylase [Brevibacterium litoralis]|uniref:3-methyladenine DNA glycosylase n=1 Tax=Brevibacterium litoralis TaxID=3138935 RepID=UPI003D9A69E6
MISIDLPPADWHRMRASHEEFVGTRTAAHRERRAAGQKHPVEDFLFTYYPFKPGKIAQWHPGAGRRVLLADVADAEAFHRRWYRVVPAPTEAPADAEVPAGTGGQGASAAVAGGGADPAVYGYAEVDTAAWYADRGEGARFVVDLLQRTLARPGTFNCFGLHEWAMVYKLREGERRHEQVPLRLSRAETDAVVEAHRIGCSHFDAYRFFTPAAEPLNELRPERATMTAMEQPGCLHGNMDLYKWAMKLGPVVPSHLVRRAFELAVEIRATDMEASPYDVRPWGYGVVAIETAEGKAEYVRRQRDFADRGNDLRRDLLAEIARVPELSDMF